MEIKLKGIKALIVLGGIVLLITGRFLYALVKENRALTREAVVRTIDPWVKSYYTRKILPDFKSAVDNGDSKLAEDLSRELTNIEYKSITVKGIFHPFIVRAEIMVDGKIPTDGRSFRYFRIEYDDMLNYWTCGSSQMSCETNEFAYRTSLIPRKQWGVE